MSEKLFDYALSNPPYQDDNHGDNDTWKPAVYDSFIEKIHALSSCSVVIHPARFLNSPGRLSQSFLDYMLHDEHICVLDSWENSQDVFPFIKPIKGGVCITLRDDNSVIGPIGDFYVSNSLHRSIVEKVINSTSFESISGYMFTSSSYGYSSVFADKYSALCANLSDLNIIRTNAFSVVSEIFEDEKHDGSVGILGRVSDGSRVIKYIDLELITFPDNFDKWKVILPKSNGSGAIGEVLSTPLIGQPLIGHTQTFMSIGAFDTEEEAQACLKYIKTKFARVVLGARKRTQHNPPRVWGCVPWQDFSSNSDIDWSKSVAEIDQQLYKKYGLTEEEINFIETNVKEMV